MKLNLSHKKVSSITSQNDYEGIMSGRTTSRFKFIKFHSNIEVTPQTSRTVKIKKRELSQFELNSIVQDKTIIDKPIPRSFSTFQKPQSISTQTLFCEDPLNAIDDQNLNQFTVKEIYQVFQVRQFENKLQVNESVWNKFLKRWKESTSRNRFICVNQDFRAQATLFISQLLIKYTDFFELNLSCNNIGDQGALFIANLIENTRSLVSITLQNNNISSHGANAIFNALSKNISINDFNFSSPEGLNRNRIAKEGSIALQNVLSKNEFLIVLSLKSTSIESDDALHISDGLIQNKELISLDLSQNGLTNKNIQRFFYSLRFPRKLIMLDLSYNKIGDSSMKYLSQLLDPEDGRSKLQKLDISKTGITGQGFSYIALKLCSNKVFSYLIFLPKHLKSLKLNHNMFHQQQSQVVQKLLEHSSLQVLEMRDCNIQFWLGEYIGKGLATNRHLQEFYLGNNSISEGVVKLTEKLNQNTTLKILELNHNNINNQNGLELIQNLEHNFSLHSIDLSQNLMEEDCACAAIEYLKTHQHIQTFLMQKNFIDYNIYSELDKYITENEKKEKEQVVPELKKQLRRLSKSANKHIGEQIQSQVEKSGETIIKIESGQVPNIFINKKQFEKFYEQDKQREKQLLQQFQLLKDELENLNEEEKDLDHQLKLEREKINSEEKEAKDALDDMNKQIVSYEQRIQYFTLSKQKKFAIYKRSIETQQERLQEQERIMFRKLREQKQIESYTNLQKKIIQGPQTPGGQKKKLE